MLYTWQWESVREWTWEKIAINLLNANHNHINVSIMHERGSVKNKTDSVMSLNGSLSNYELNIVFSNFKTYLRTRLEGTGLNGWKFHNQMTKNIWFLGIRKNRRRYRHCQRYSGGKGKEICFEVNKTFKILKCVQVDAWRWAEWDFCSAQRHPSIWTHFDFQYSNIQIILN